MYDSQGGGGRDGVGIWGQKMQSSKHRIDKQQGPTIPQVIVITLCYEY